MKNLDKVFSSKIRKLTGCEYDTNVIPKGIYCYEYDKIKTDLLIDEWNNGFYVKVCPYHIMINDKIACCAYTSNITKDKKFVDKNKICNINKHT